MAFVLTISKVLHGGVSTMIDESEMDLFDKLMSTTDREESIKLARKLFPEMSEEDIIATVDKSLAGYYEAAEIRRE